MKHFKKILAGSCALSLFLGLSALSSGTVVPAVGKEVSPDLNSNKTERLVQIEAAVLSGGRFKDVPSDSWYYQYVEDMSAQGYLSGASASYFQPMEELSVAAFATMLANGFYGNSLAQNSSGSQWWEAYMLACDQRDGLDDTVAEEKYSWENVANSPISRYDMAEMIENLLDDRNVKELSDREVAEIISTLPDEIPKRYQEAVATAYHYGFITGKSQGGFDGAAFLNRAEASVVLSALVHSDLVSVERIPENSSTNPAPTTPDSSNFISQEEAKSIALAHANVSAKDANFVKVEFDYDDGVPEFEVEFYVGYEEYDYEIHAITGAILSYDRDMESPRPSNPSTTTPDSSNFISQEEAKSIALAHANVSAIDASFAKVEFDYDDGVAEYEVEFQVGKVEYEYEINATSGAILSFDRD